MASHSVLFVCLGNICRSPMAQILFEALIEERGMTAQWRVDSAGTAAYHEGDEPDPRTVRACKGYLDTRMPPVTHRARQIRSSDFGDFEYVLCMDRNNLKGVKVALTLTENASDLTLLGTYDPDGVVEVDDPYYGGNDGFARLIDRTLRAFLDHVHAMDGQ